MRNGGVAMKISRGVYFNKIAKSYNATIDSTAKASGIRSIQDKIEISDMAREVQVATKAFKDLPDVRHDLVKHLKDAIASGTYKPSASDIARKMLSLSEA